VHQHSTARRSKVPACSTKPTWLSCARHREADASPVGEVTARKRWRRRHRGPNLLVAETTHIVGKGRPFAVVCADGSAKRPFCLKEHLDEPVGAFLSLAFLSSCSTCPSTDRAFSPTARSRRPLAWVDICPLRRYPCVRRRNRRLSAMPNGKLVAIPGPVQDGHRRTIRSRPKK
jgi:hypothetical protein